MSAYVLDAGAMIAYLRKETGWERVADALAEADTACYAHAAQLAEVFYDFCRTADEGEAARQVGILFAAGVKAREDMDTLFWQDLARIKAGPNPSFADCFCLALARRVEAPVLTTDHHELDKDEIRALCQVQFIREKPPKKAPAP